MDYIVTIERQLAALAEAVENYAANQKPKMRTEDCCVLTDVMAQ